MELAINTKNLSKKYGDFSALSSLDLEVKKGEILGYLGPNGAGKTTTIRLILGLIKPTTGSAQIFGIDSQKNKTEAHKRIAYIPGESTFWPNLTGAETLYLLGKIHGKVDQKYQAELIKRFHFDPSKKVRTYSKGNRQKINIIAAMMTRADLLMMDEPTTGLDPIMEQAFRQSALEAKSNGQTIFLSSHILEEVEALCDRVAILRAGKLVELGTLSEMRHLSALTVQATFGEKPPNVDHIKGISGVKIVGHQLTCQIRGPIDPLFSLIIANHPKTLLSREPSLEELFLSLYGDERRTQEWSGIVSVLEFSSSAVNFKYFRSPKNILRRFVEKRIRISSLIFGAVVGIYCYSKASAFLTTYATYAARQKIAESLGTNVGIEALLGQAHHIETVAGYATWNFLCLIAAGGAIWALLLATKIFRGEEDSGRFELFLAGQTSPKRAAINSLAGLASGLLIIYIFLSLSIIAIGHLHGANFTLSSSLFFALCLICGAAEFLAIGALASQLMPTRSRAVSLSVIVFGIFYSLRLAADATNAHWLLNVGPLGWIEKLQPLYNSQPIWLLPIGGFIAILCGFTIYLASKRDLGAATFGDKVSAKPHMKLLNSPFSVSFRLNRSFNLGWLIGITIEAFFFGLLTKSIEGAFTKSAKANQVLSRLTQASLAASVEVFMGIIFFLVMVVVMFYVAGAIGRIRQDEAEGYLDNFLVRSVSRAKWLRGRITLIFGVLILAGLLSSAGSWLGQASEHAGLSFNTLLLAGINAMTPALLVLGIGIFVYGIAPRLTSILTYASIGWSFLIVMLSSGLNLNHWLLDTSILHHIVFAPAVSPNWKTDLVFVIISLVLCIIGLIQFNRRDIQGN